MLVRRSIFPLRVLGARHGMAEALVARLHIQLNPEVLQVSTGAYC